MSRKNKKNPNASNPNPDAASAANGGQAGEFVQRSLFDKMGESQLLLFLKELITGLVSRVANLEQLLMQCLNRLMGGAPFTAKDYYTPKEFAKIVGLKVETVREYLKEDRIEGIQTHSGRGGKPEWRISHDELKRYQRDKLKPMSPEKQYRHFK